MIPVFFERWAYLIKVYDSEFQNGNVIFFIKWENFKFQTFMRWKWYFEYRYALLRVKYPKNCIVHEELRRQLTDKETKDTEKENLKNKIIGKKRTISKFKNRLYDYEEEYKKNLLQSQLFPVEQDEYWLAGRNKIDRLEVELVELLKIQNEN